jgi:hypothetical protein
MDTTSTDTSQPPASSSTNAPGVTNTPRPTATPVLGKTRDTPLPGNEGVDLGNGIFLTILAVDLHADAVVRQGNRFTETPTPNQEYAIISLQLECRKTENNQCSFSPFDIKAVGSDGQVRDRAHTPGVPERLEEFSYNFFGGSTITGSLVFLIPKDDTKVVLFYEKFLSDPIYISLQ